MVESPAGIVKTRALLDTGSSASFVSERLAQSLHLSRYCQNARICGTAGLQHSNGKQSVVQFVISSTHTPDRRHSVNAFIVPQVTSDLPVCSTTLDTLARSFTRRPRLRQGRKDRYLTRCRSVRRSDTSWPAFWPSWLTNTSEHRLLAGDTCSQAEMGMVTTHLTSILAGDDLFGRYWEVE